MAEQGCLLSSCAGDPGAEGSNPSLSAARPRAVVNRSPSRRPLTAGFRFRLGGAGIEGRFETSAAPNRDPVAVADANQREAPLDDEIPRNPEFGSTSAFAGPRRETRLGFRFVC